MAKTKSMTIKNTFEEMGALCSEFHEFLKGTELASATVYVLDLALEEMVTNIIKYGYDDKGGHNIRVEVEIGDEAAHMLIEDDGHEFDPLNQAMPDLDRDITEREIGGVGIFLTRNMVSEINYSRENNKNKLRITVNL
tara:strand:+ start:720 stop:1133 length:414 start_codon:yes stop_codon:yes gene_type:complete